MRSVGAEGIIIADKSLTKEEQSIIVDQCLEYNFKVYNVPLISNWENQKEISQKVKNIEIEDLLERQPIVLDNKSITKQLKDKTVLITGAAGSIGSEIVRQVLSFHPKKIITMDQECSEFIAKFLSKSQENLAVIENYMLDPQSPYVDLENVKMIPFDSEVYYFLNKNKLLL